MQRRVLRWVWDSRTLTAAVDIALAVHPQPADFAPVPAAVSSQRVSPAHADTAAVSTVRFPLRGSRDCSESLLGGAGS